MENRLILLPPLRLMETGWLVGTDFFPFPYSPDIKIEALPSIAVREAEMPWFIDLNDPIEENKNNPHFDLANYIYTNAKKAGDKGASAVILYNTDLAGEKITFNEKDKSETLNIPDLIYIKRDCQKVSQ